MKFDLHVCGINSNSNLNLIYLVVANLREQHHCLEATKHRHLELQNRLDLVSTLPNRQHHFLVKLNLNNRHRLVVFLLKAVHHKVVVVCLVLHKLQHLVHHLLEEVEAMELQL